MKRILESVEEEENDPDFLLLCIGLSVLLLFMVIAAICLCDRHYRLIEMLELYINSSTRANSDEVYGDEVLRRQMEEEEKKKEDPELRRKRLGDYFDKKGVSTVIGKESYVVQKELRSLSTNTEHTDTCTNCSIAASSTLNSNDNDDDDDSRTGSRPDANDEEYDEEKEEPEEIYLPTSPDMEPRKVPNCCAICLCGYDVGDTVVFSSSFASDCRDNNGKDDMEGYQKHAGRSNRFSAIRRLIKRQDQVDEQNDGNDGNQIPGPCLHAFHRECILDYLQGQIGTPCPCCRREFTDLVPMHKEKEMVSIRSRDGNGRNRVRYATLRNPGSMNDDGGGGNNDGNDDMDNINEGHEIDDITVSVGARVTIGPTTRIEYPPDGEIV